MTGPRKFVFISAMDFSSSVLLMEHAIKKRVGAIQANIARKIRQFRTGVAELAPPLPLAESLEGRALQAHLQVGLRRPSGRGSDALVAVNRRRQRNAHGCPAVARIDVNTAVVIEDRAFDN